MTGSKEPSAKRKEPKGAGKGRRRNPLKREETVDPPMSGHVIYIGHIPHGFYEDQMRSYFAQFGRVTRVRLSRNKKTGKSKHYAFVEFGNADVAAIAADAMNGYMMFKQRIVTHVMKEEDLHPELFKGANQKYKVLPRQRLERERQNLPKSAEQVKKNLENMKKRDRLRRRKLEDAGIEYEFPGQGSAMKKQKQDTSPPKLPPEDDKSKKADKDKGKKSKPITGSGVETKLSKTIQKTKSAVSKKPIKAPKPARSTRQTGKAKAAEEDPGSERVLRRARKTIVDPVEVVHPDEDAPARKPKKRATTRATKQTAPVEPVRSPPTRRVTRSQTKNKGL